MSRDPPSFRHPQRKTPPMHESVRSSLHRALMQQAHCTVQPCSKPCSADDVRQLPDRPKGTSVPPMARRPSEVEHREAEQFGSGATV
eukprot:360722-Chlamydomonas_euryale.AAC.2